MNKIKTFFRNNMIWKLKKIGELLNLNIYPKKFYNKGFRSIYPKLIFNLIMFSRTRTLKKHFYNKVFDNKKFNKNIKKNFLFSTPSSGGTFLRMMISSYLELFHKIGDGVAKYDSIHNKWMYSFPFIEGAYLKDEIGFSMLTFDLKKYRPTDDLENKKIIFSRYPISPIELYDFDRIKPIIIMRHPHDQIISYYSKNFKDQKDETLDNRLLDRAVSNYVEYFTFWNKYFYEKKKEEDYLLIKYENLISNSENVFRKVLSFYNFEIDDELISKAALINSKEFTLKSISNIKINKIRFTDEDKKKKNRKKILDELNKIDRINKLIKDYSEIK